MGLFNRKKQSQPQEAPRLEIARWKNAPPRRDTAKLLDAYKTLPRLASVIDVVADAVAEVEWTVSRNGELDPSHPLLTLLANPNEFISGRDLLKLICVHLDLVGEAYVAIEEIATYPVSLWVIPPDTIVNLPDVSLPKAQRVYTVNTPSGQRHIAADSVIPIKRLDPKNPLGRGVGLAQALSDELDTDEFASLFLKNTLYNNALPAAVIGIEGLEKGGSPAAKAFMDTLKREHGGPDNAGRVLLTSGKTTLARLDTPLKDLGLVELRKYLEDFIRITYRVPPEIIGDLTSANRATAFAAREHLAVAAVQPRIKTIQAAFQKYLAGRFGPVVSLGFAKVIPSDKDRVLEVMKAMPQAFSYDEWRALADMDPDPERSGYPMPLPGQKPEDPPQG